MRVDWRKPCISDNSLIAVSTKIFKVPGFRGAPHPHLNCPRRSSPLVLLVRSLVLVFIENFDNKLVQGGEILPSAQTSEGATQHQDQKAV